MSCYGRKNPEAGICKIVKDLTGQIVLITGASSGMGKEAAHTLARMNATIVLACRDVAKGAVVLKEISSETGNKKLEVMKLDLSDLKSIKAFADEFKTKHQQLNTLINNAALVLLERQFTKDGYEMQFGTAHLGHFYLTNLLLDLIKRTPNSRVINITSRMAFETKIKWNDLMFEKGYESMAVYKHAKLANILFTKELQKRLQNDNTKVVSVNPGMVRTDIGRDYDKKWIYRTFLSVLYAIKDTKTAQEGAQTYLYCALEDFDKLKAGGYYTDCLLAPEKPIVQNEEDWKKLWDVSEKLINEKL